MRQGTHLLRVWATGKDVVIGCCNQAAQYSTDKGNEQICKSIARYLSIELVSWKCWGSSTLAAATGSICCRAPAEVAMPSTNTMGSSACACQQPGDINAVENGIMNVIVAMIAYKGNTDARCDSSLRHWAALHVPVNSKEVSGLYKHQN